jgi:hypothetical protein
MKERASPIVSRDKRTLSLSSRHDILDNQMIYSFPRSTVRYAVFLGKGTFAGKELACPPFLSGQPAR